jgi:hypothetical protein
MSRHDRNYRQIVTWKLEFDDIIEKYQSVKVTNGSIGCMDYEQVMSGIDGGNTMNIVTPNSSDFIADVELAARHALRNDPNLWTKFEHFYIWQAGDPDLADMEIDNIRLMVGRELSMRRIAPEHFYKKPKYVDRVKEPK